MMGDTSQYCIQKLALSPRVMASMEIHFITIFALFSLMLVGGSNASLPAEEYWYSKLPNTPMPKELQNLLQPDIKGNYAFWDMDDSNEYDEAFRNRYEEAFRNRYDEAFRNRYDEAFRNRYDEAFRNRYDEAFRNRYDEAFRNRYDEEFRNRYEEAFRNRNEDEFRNRYEEEFRNRYEEAFADTLPNSTIFFMYNDLHAGQKMKLHITKSTNKARILPRQVAESIPFSSDQLPEIFRRLSIKPESMEAKIIKKKVEDCESIGIKGEDRFCPTSLESMIDFVVSHVGNRVQVLYNKINKPTRAQEYTILDVKMVGENQVVCHKQKYPYAVYYCHSISSTKVYMAPLVGADGTKAIAVAVCHSDTSNWNPRHLAFLMLKAKPGEGPICHFIKSDALVWASNEFLKLKLQ
eukprot:XP_002523253.2 BURP domain-containing protein 5 [Ricinus communis]